VAKGTLVALDAPVFKVEFAYGLNAGLVGAPRLLVASLLGHGEGCEKLLFVIVQCEIRQLACWIKKNLLFFDLSGATTYEKSRIREQSTPLPLLTEQDCSSSHFRVVFLLLVGRRVHLYLLHDFATTD